MARLEDLKNELAATIFYGEQIGEKLEAKDLSDAERTDLNADLEAVEIKAKGLQREIQSETKTVERELAIRGIGRDMDVAREPVDEPVVAYKDAVDAFFKSDTFAQFAEDVKAGKRDSHTDPVEYKAPANVVSDMAGDKVTEYVPGIANQNFRFPLSVGDLFSQGRMSGSNISYLVIPAGATGDADYQATLGEQKGGTFAMTLDVALETAKTVAARALIPSQNLDDIDALEGEVRQTLLIGPNGVGEMLEDAYINGTGGSSEIQGILDLSPDDSTMPGEYLSKSIFKAAADINAATGFQADAVVLHPDDWFLASTETGTVDNRPLFGAWGSGWGTDGIDLRLVVSRKITAGTILVGAFKAATRYVRQGLTIAADQAGLGLRDKNLVLFVAEAREAVVHRYGKQPFRVVSSESGT